MIKACLFDLDKTVIKYNNESIDDIIIEKWLNSCGIKNPKEIMFSNDWEDLDKRMNYFGIDYNTFMKNWNPIFKEVEYSVKIKELKDGKISLYSYSREFINNINIPKALVTNSSEKIVDKLLNYFNIKDCFDYIFTRNYDSIDLRKPDPKVLEKTKNNLNINDNKFLMIGDSKTDLDFCKNTGMKFLNINYKVQEYNLFFENYRSLEKYCITNYSSIFRGKK